MSSVTEAAGTSSPAALAERYGLTSSAQRPSLLAYCKSLWGRRQFILTYTHARSYASYAGARLGQVWQLLTPLLNAAVYYLIFGLILGTRANVPNYTLFLLVGLFIFTFTQRCVLEGAKAISSNISLIRTLHFPRASLPLAYVLNELSQVGISVVILMVAALLTGEPLTVRWLLVIPALALQLLFNAGVTMLFARWGAFLSDINQIMPFAIRTWLYVSGIFYSIPQFMAGKPHILLELMSINPVAAYIGMVRAAFMTHIDNLPHIWLTGAVWSVAIFVIGFVVFWQSEQRYGRG